MSYCVVLGRVDAVLGVGIVLGVGVVLGEVDIVLLFWKK